ASARKTPKTFFILTLPWSFLASIIACFYACLSTFYRFLSKKFLPPAGAGEKRIHGRANPPRLCPATLLRVSSAPRCPQKRKRKRIKTPPPPERAAAGRSRSAKINPVFCFHA